SPRRIERPAAGEAPQQVAVGIEHIDEAIAGTGHIVMHFRVLLCIADEQVAIDVLDAERRKTGRDIRIGEPAFDFLTRCGYKTNGAIRRESIDFAGVKVSGKKKYTPWIGPEDETFVNRAASGIVDGDDCVTGVRNRSRPRRNRSVLGSEDEGSSDGRARDEEGRGRVPDEARWGRRRRRRRICLGGSRLASRTGHGIIGQRDRHLDRRHFHPGAVVKGRTARGVVGDPEGARVGSKRHAPGIPQDLILEVGYAILVGDEFVDDIGISLALEAVIIGADGGRTGDRDRNGGSTGKIAIEALHVCPPLIGALAGIRRAAPQVALATATRDGPPLRSYDSPNRSLFHRKPRARAASRSPQDGASAGFAGNWREFGFGAFG